MFGLISLLVTIALIAWWFTSSAGPLQNTVDEEGNVQESSYQEAIGSARDAASSLER